jgi:uncharacterized Fe-S cluster-containing radical SAM superfamily protein
VKRVAEFASKLYVHISFKVATPKGFTQRTGSIGEYFELPFKALRYLLEEGIYARAVARAPPRHFLGALISLPQTTQADA